jgi:tetratricopeptide (TPR) repeat protein
MIGLDSHISATAAFGVSTKNRNSARWPRRSDDSRLEPQANVIIQPRFPIALTDVVFTIGSCFARNIEEYLGRLGMTVPTLDFAVPPTEMSGRPSAILNKYTVPSVRQEVERAARVIGTTSPQDRDKILSETLLDVGDGKVIDMELVGLDAVTRERGLQRRREVHDLFAKAFDSEVVTITFGLIEAWYDNETQRYIQETPPPALVKRFPDRFSFVMLGLDTCLEHARRTISLLNGLGGPKKIIITTSPVPLGRTFSGIDILMANTLAKACLRTMCHMLWNEFDNVDYFPSYEMVVLSKDPEIWQDDLIHVSDHFVGKIVTTLISNYTQGGIAEAGVKHQAWVLMRSRRNAEALPILENAASAYANDAEFQILRGMALIIAHQRASGLSIVREHAGTAQLSIDQALMFTRLLIALDAHDIAIPILDLALSSRRAATRDAAILLALRALCAAALDDDETARSFIVRALEEHQSQTVLTIAGQVALRQSRLDEAHELLTKALGARKNLAQPGARVPTYAKIYESLAELALCQQSWDLAASYCRDALWHGSDNPRFQALSRRIEAARASSSVATA